MAFFSRKSKQKATDGLSITQEDEILGYLDELFRKRIQLSFRLKNKTVSTDILFIEKKTKTLRIQMDTFGSMPHGTDLSAGFALDRTWWTFKTKLVIIQDKPHLLIPKQIEHSERRKQPRTAFTPREQVKVTIMEGIGSGSGAFGMATDIGLGGMCLTIEKAMILSNEKEIYPSPTLFKKDAKLAFIKINRLPGSQILELQGVANRVYKDGKWRLAVSFGKLNKTAQQSINRFVVPRILEFKYVKRSQKKREEMEQMRSSYPAPAKGGGAESKPAVADTPAASSTTSSASGEKTRILFLGTELRDQLGFLNSDNGFHVFVGTTPISVIKMLSENEPKALLVGEEFKGRNSLEVLEKIMNMGVLNEKRVIFVGSDITAKDRIKLKMLNINEVVNLPINDQQEFMQTLAR